MKNLLHEFALATGLLAMGGGAAAVTSAILFDEAMNLPMLTLAAIVAFMVFSAYHLNRKAELEADSISHPQRSRLIAENKILDGVAIALLLLLFPIAYFSSKMPAHTLLILLIVPVAVALYSVPWVPRSLRRYIYFKRLKELSVFKNLIVAVVWGMIALLVTTYYGLTVTFLTLFVFLIIFFRLLINTITFDIGDLKADKVYRVRTIPVVLGVGKTKLLLYSINTVFGLFMVFSAWLGYLPPYAVFLSLVTLYGYYFIYKAGARSKTNHFLYDVIIDGEAIFWPVLLIAGKLILRA